MTLAHVFSSAVLSVDSYANFSLNFFAILLSLFGKACCRHNFMLDVFALVGFFTYRRRFYGLSTREEKKRKKAFGSPI